MNDLEKIQEVFGAAEEVKNKFLTAALWYLKTFGYSVIPVNKDKKPFVPWLIYQSTKATEADLRKWWGMWPEANVGIVTGKISNLTVIDIDDLKVLETIAFPETFTVLTGKGQHLYYQFSDTRNTVNIGGLKIDLRSEGGFVIAAPSRHLNGKDYKITNTMAVQPFPTEWLDKTQASRDKSDWKDSLLAENSKGSRNATFAGIIGGIIQKLPLDDFEIVGWNTIQSLNITHNKPPLSEKELRATFNSIASRERKKRQSTNEIKVIGDLTVTQPDEETYIIETPFELGSLKFSFSDLQDFGINTTAIFSCQIEVAGKSESIPPLRFKLLSTSNYKDIVGLLQKCLDPNNSFKINWTLLLSKACHAIARLYEKDNELVELPSDVVNTQTEYLAYPFIDKDGLVILFGDGGVGKSYLALNLALKLGVGGRLLGHDIPGGYRTLYLDFERTKNVFDIRIKRMREPLGISYEEVCQFIGYKRIFTPIYENVKTIKNIIKNGGYDFIIIDSLLGASGNNLLESDNAGLTSQAIKKLQTSVLVIAHITKNSDEKMPFGSAFWHNEASRTFNIQSTQMEVSVDLALFNRKNNTDKKLQPIGGEMVFDENTTIIKEKTIDLDEEYINGETDKAKILRYLTDYYQTPKELNDITGINYNTIKSVLHRLKIQNIVDCSDGKYRKKIPLTELEKVQDFLEDPNH